MFTCSSIFSYIWFLDKLNQNPQNNHPYPLTPQYYLAEMAPQDMLQVQVSQEDFLLAVQHLVPSVSQLEMEHYARVQERFSTKSSNGKSAQ